jgi:hypothetical protein
MYPVDLSWCVQGALASTLLVLQPVLKGSVAEAFLASLAATQRAVSRGQQHGVPS